MATLSALAVVVGAGCSRPSPPAAGRPLPLVAKAPEPPAAEPEPPMSWVAAATGPSVAVYDDPSAAQPSRRLSNPTAERYPLVFRVQERRGDWLLVRLAVRPNGSMGWVRGGEVALTPTPFRVVVELAAHRLTLYQGREVVLQDVVAVGTAQHPTPVGEFFVDATVELANAGGAYGPYQLSVAGFSNVLTRFAGGAGQIALHGTNNPAALGRDVSHGCIRLRNESITRLARTVPVGTPVQVVA